MRALQFLLFLAILAIGTVGWGQWLLAAGGTIPDPLIVDSAYRAIQLFLGNFDRPADMQAPIPWLLQIARFTAPLITVWAVVELIGGHVSTLPRALWAEATGQDEFVVVGFGEVGKAIAGAIATSSALRTESRRKPRVVVLDRTLDRIERQGAAEIGVEARMADAGSLGNWKVWTTGLRRAVKVFIAAGDDERTLAIAARLIARNNVDPANLWIHIGDYGLLDRLRDIDPAEHADSARLPRYFNLYEAAVEKLLVHDASVVACAASGFDRGHMAIVGLDQFSRLLIENFALYGAMGPPAFALPAVTIIDPAASAFAEEIAARHPRLDDFIAIRTVDARPASFSWMGGCARIDGLSGEIDVSHWVFSNANLPHALALYRGMTMERQRPARIFVASTAKGAHSGLSGATAGDGAAQVEFYGNLGEASIFSISLNPLLGDIAAAFHEEWRGDTGPEFDDLSETMRLSNWRAALHAMLKLRVLGFDTVDPCHATLGLSSAEIQRLRSMLEDRETIHGMGKFEHLRWCVDRILDGWTEGEVSDDKRRTRDQLAHGLDDYDGLSDEESEKDRNQMRSLVRVLEKRSASASA